MAEENKFQLDSIQQQTIDKIAQNDLDGFAKSVAQLKGGVNYVDEHGMTPLQHASCKGNREAVQILLDMGADINFNQHGASYTPLHFAALSGKIDVCRILLDAGINPNITNSVSRTASQMAAFVGNHACVDVINNYVPREQLEQYTKEPGQLLPPALLDSFHAFVVSVSLHPVRIALNLQSLGLLKHLGGLQKALEQMCKREMSKPHDVNELMAFKFHYLRWIVMELVRCEEQCKVQHKDKPTEAGKHDFVEVFIKRVLKENKQGQLDYVEFKIRDCVREFPFRECTIFRQVVFQLAAKDTPPALVVLRNAINGQRGFMDDTSCCSTCGDEKPDKKCSKCKAVQYCDRGCQRFHWFMHKKTCARPISTVATNVSDPKDEIDVGELREEIARLTTS